MTDDGKDKLAKNLFSTFDNEVEYGKKVDLPAVPKKEPMHVYLRIRPLTSREIDQKESQGCVVIKNPQNVEICAPKDSFTFKSSIRGLTDQTHQFSFSHVFNEKTQQKQFFDDTMLPFVKSILDGQNGLVFTYGVTNSGKTYTIQGTPKDGGILPRALDVIFNSISKKLYTRPNLKPKHCYDVVRLSPEEEKTEELVCNTIFHADDKENIDLSVFKYFNSTAKTESLHSSNNSLPDISIIQKSGSILDTADINEELRQRVSDETSIEVDDQGNFKYGMWVSFMEIYNEVLYDLLDLTPIGKGKKRPTLKMGDDKIGNPYVKGLKEVFVKSSDEAYKVLRLGQKNRHMAATKLNQNSSRSHCIFTIKLLKIMDIEVPHVARISRLSIVDLAGSERYCRTNAIGDTLKEASNINLSMLTLGKCINYLRYNQNHPNNATIIPFRESKLTRLFQSFFMGKGKASMIVNISQCASVFDETYNVMKFSAVAKQVKMKAERATEMWKVPPLPKIPATPSNSRPPLCIVTPATARKKRTLEDPSAFNYEELINIVAELRDKVKKERREKATMEKSIRGEVSKEMGELIVEIENSHSAQLMEQKQSLEETMEKRLDLLTKTVNKQRKRKKTDHDDDDSYVSSVLLHAEKMKVKERDENILVLEAKLAEVEAEQDFLKKSGTPENHSKLIESIKNDLDEAKETLRLQNEDITHMQMMLQRKDDEIEKLKDALEDEDNTREQENSAVELQQLLEVTIKELEIARVKLDGRDERIKELEETSMSQKADIEASKKEITKWSAQYKELDDNYKTIQFENDETSIKLDKYESLFKEHETVLIENESIIEQLNQQVNELKKQLTNDEACYDAICKEEKKDEKVKLKKELEFQEQIVNQYSEKILRLEKQLQCFQATNALSSKKCNNVFATPDKSIVTPIKKQHATPLRSPVGSPAFKQNQTGTIKKLEKFLEDTTKALEKKTNIVVTKTNRIQQLETKITQLEKKTGINNVIAEKESIKLQMENLNKELDELHEAHNKLQFESDNQEESIASLENELNTWMKNHKLCQENLQKSQQEIIKLNEEKVQQSNDNELSVNLYQKKIKQMEESIEKLNKVNEKNTALENQVIKLQTEIQNLDTSYKKIQDDVKQRDKVIQEAKTKTKEDQEIINNLRREQEECLINSKQLSKQLEDRRKSRVDHSALLARQQDGYEARIQTLHSQNDELDEQVSQLKALNHEFESHVKSLDEEVSKLKKRNEQLLSSNEELIRELSSVKDDALEMSKKLTSKDMDLSKLVTDKEYIEASFKTTTDEVDELKAQIETITKASSEKSKELSEILMKMSFMEEEKTYNFNAISRLEQERSECQAIITSLKNSEKNNSKEEELELLKTEQNQVKQELAKYKTEVSMLEESMTGMTKDNMELKESLLVKEKEIKQANDEKRVALAELLKQTAKTTSNLKRALEPIVIEDDQRSDSPDPDFTPYKLPKVVNKENVHSASLRRSNRKANAERPKKPLKESVVNCESISESSAGFVSSDGISETSFGDSGSTSEDVSMVCSVSIALSPFNSCDLSNEAKNESSENDYLTANENECLTANEKEYSTSNENDCLTANENDYLTANENDYLTANEDTDTYPEVNVDDFVAVRCNDDFEAPPVIGKVIETSQNQIQLEMWEGGFTKAWRIMKNNGEIVYQKFLKRQILSTDITFTSSKRLPLIVKRKLQTAYTKME